jgi:hypothetical protein
MDMLPFYKKPCSIYFAQVIGSGGPIKIGSTVNPMNRLISLQGWCPYKIDFLAVVPDSTRLAEEVLLERLLPSRLRLEWFNPTDEVLRVVGHAIEHKRLPPDVEAEIARLLRKRKRPVFSYRKRGPYGMAGIEVVAE